MEKTNYIEIFHEQMAEMMNKDKHSNCLTIGSDAPQFVANTTFGECKLSDYAGKWLVLFSHPRRLYTSMYYRIYIFCKV
jgi:hypothetical protein